MLKKALAVFSLIILSMLYLSANSLFYLETVTIVKGAKSKGSFFKGINCPFIEKTGMYKSFDGKFNYKPILEKLSASFVMEENLGEIKSFYYYSDSISNFEIIKGKRVNLQIALSNEKIVIGSPIIYGGY